MILALALGQNPQVGQEWSPVWEVPVRSAVTKRVTLLKVRWNYWQQRYEPKLSQAQKEWMQKYGHYLLNWRWSLSQGKWIRKRGSRLCLT